MTGEKKSVINDKVLIARLETMIFESLAKAIPDALSGYQSPMKEIVNRVVNNHDSKIYELFSRNLEKALEDKGFEEIIFEEFQRKIAKNLVGKLEGEVEKSVDKYRQNPELKAKMIMAIQNMIKQHNPEGKTE